MKSYTDLEQSKKLAYILPIESADMIWVLANPDLPMIKAIAYEDSEKSKYYEILPAWSLSALLELIPNYVINKADDKIYANLYYGFKSSHDNLVDAAFEMILELHELKML